MTTTFEVRPGLTPGWPDMPAAARVVCWFLAHVRVTGDEEAAARVLAPLVPAHQVVSDHPETILRTPAEYARHVQDMLATSGRFRFTVTELLTEADRVYVRWRQDGHDLADGSGRPATGLPLTDVGSAVYRVEDGRIVEYWVQLDRLGLERQQRRIAREAARDP